MEEVISAVVTKDDLTHNYMDNCGCPLYHALQRSGHPVTVVHGQTVQFKPESEVVEYAIMEHYELCVAAYEEKKEPLLIHLIRI